jgi:hypothetical protein
VTAHDESGNVIPIDPASTVGQLVALLEYARARGWRIGPFVKLDGLTIQVQDLRQREGQGIAPPPDVGPWTAAGYDEGDQ